MQSVKPYIAEPPIAKAAQRLALIATYLGVATVGFVSVTSVTVAYLVPFGYALMALAAIAIFGVVSSKYRYEWCVLPFIITVCLIIAITLLPVTVGFSVGLLFTVAAHLGYRFVYLTVIAKRIRENDIDEPPVLHV